MSRMSYIYTVHECIFDDDGNIKQDFDFNLPHRTEIGKRMESSWNSARMEQFFDGILDRKIQRAIMSVVNVHTAKGLETQAIIRVDGNAGVRFPEKIRNAIAEQLDAQMVDGWGEGIFGYGKIMTMPDGTKICVE